MPTVKEIETTICEHDPPALFLGSVPPFEQALEGMDQSIGILGFHGS